MQLRLASEADLDALHAIEALSRGCAAGPRAEFEARFRAHSGSHPWLVAVEAERVLGCARAGPWSGGCTFTHAPELSIHLAADARGRGVGTALYARLLALLEAQGFAQALAWIELPNPASVALHEGAGFARVGLIERALAAGAGWHDVGLWRRELSSTGPQSIRGVASSLSE